MSEPLSVPDSWLAFWHAGSSPSGKTQIWDVCTKLERDADVRGVHLGVIRWAAHWRKYSFFPNGGTWYEVDCLRAIAAFCERLTREHRTPAEPNPAQSFAAGPDAMIIEGGGRDHTPEKDVAGVRTILRVQLADEQLERIGISEDRDLVQCVMRLCDALTETERLLKKILLFHYAHETPGYFRRLDKAAGEARALFEVQREPPREWAGEDLT